MQRFLVTTALEQTWDVKRPIVFLGEWCRLFGRRDLWSPLDGVVHPYHWDDRAKYREDYVDLSALYEKKLAQLSQSLGRMHGLPTTPEYWRIIIGPWLRFFADALFDRFESVRSVIDSGGVDGSRVMQYRLTDWVPADFLHFYSNFVGDAWNHIVYAESMRSLGMPFSELDEVLSPPAPASIRRSYRQVAKRMFERYCQAVPQRFNRVALVSAALPAGRLSRLQYAMGQFPYPRSPVLRVESTAFDVKKRQSVIANDASGGFEALLDKLLRQWMPRSYIENFPALRRLALEKYPEAPSVIFTANAYQADDGFKIWAAHHIHENRVPLVIGQHGGNMGISLFNQTEDHQIRIADLFATWGWSTEGQSNVRPMPAMKLGVLGARPDVGGDILLTTASYPRYFYCHYAIPVAGQYLEYLQDQIRFVQCLAPEMRQFVKIRPDADNFGWDVLARLREAGLGEAIDAKKESLGKRLKRCRLSVATYNSTIFLETLAENFPTLVFFDPGLFEIRPEAVAAVDMLRRVGIFHDSPESAAEFLNRIGQDVFSWWNDEGLQAARVAFCNQYARTSPDWIGAWSQLFRSLRNDGKCRS